MRHFIFLAAMAGVMAFSGCTAQTAAKAPDMDKCFSVQAQLRLGKETVKAEISRRGGYMWEMAVTEPFALEGLIITADKENTTLSMCGFESGGDVTDEAVSVLRLNMDAYESTAEGECSFSENIFSGTNENGSYSLSISDGKPDVMELGGKGVMVQFGEWTELEGEEMIVY